jgi:hypothetical protein
MDGRLVAGQRSTEADLSSSHRDRLQLAAPPVAPLTHGFAHAVDPLDDEVSDVAAEAIGEFRAKLPGIGDHGLRPDAELLVPLVGQQPRVVGEVHRSHPN